MTNSTGVTHLRRGLGRLQFFVIAFGSMVGSAWVVLLGDWFAAASPGGAVVGFVTGAIVICGIAACYAEMTARLPVAGGEMIYAARVLGPFAGFVVGWFVLLFLVGTMAFEGIAIGLLASDLVPAITGPILYHSLGEPITLGKLALGIGGAVALGIVNIRGAKAAASFQTVCTAGFLILVAVAMIAGVMRGDAGNLTPLFGQVDGGSWLNGTAWIFATAPIWFNGFQGALQAVEERRPGVSLRQVGGAMMAAVVAAAAFYIAVIVSMALTTPWQQLAGKPLATTLAMDAIDPTGTLKTVVLVGALVSLVKTWNGATLTAARVVMAQARLHFLPVALARIHPRFGTPHLAVVTAVAASLIAVPFGRAALLPILSTLSISATILLMMTPAQLIMLRRRDPDAVPGFVAPGGPLLPVLTIIAALAMAAYAIVTPWFSRSGAVPVEWAVLLVWLMLGALAWALRARIVDKHVRDADGAALAEVYGEG